VVEKGFPVEKKRGRLPPGSWGAVIRILKKEGEMKCSALQETLPDYGGTDSLFGGIRQDAREFNIVIAKGRNAAEGRATLSGKNDWDSCGTTPSSFASSRQ